MEQTAIQELIQEMEQLKQTKLYQGSFKAIEDCIALAYYKLDMEKQQIIDAYEQAMETDIYNEPLKVGEQYFNEKYNK